MAILYDESSINCFMEHFMVTIQIRSVKNYSPIEFLNKLRNVDWTIVTNCTDVNKAWDNFKTIFLKL